jgi:hypothetical protein
VKPSVDGMNKDFQSFHINSTLELYSAGFIVPWLVLTNILCEGWWAFENMEKIAKLNGKK